MNSLPRIQSRNEHRLKLTLVTKLVRAFPDASPKTSAGRFLRELAERVEEYEKKHFPIPPRATK